MAGPLVTDALAERAEREGDTTAFTFLADDGAVFETTTYAALFADVRALAARIRVHADIGERALIVASPGLDYVRAVFGAMLAGVLAVPAYAPDLDRPARTAPRLRAIAQDCRPSIVLADAAQCSAEGVDRRESLFALAPELAAPTWLSANPTASPSAGSHAPRVDAPAIDADSVAYLQYTSGSTTVARGVVVTHGNLLHNLSVFRDAAGYTSAEDAPRRVKVSWLPPFHDAGLVDGLLQPVFSGMHGVLMSPLSFMKEPFRWLEALTRFGGTHSGAPNFAFDLCLRKIGDEQLASLDLRALEVMYNAAEPVRADTLVRFAERFASSGFRLESFMPCYGLAETTLIVSGSRVRRAPTLLAVDAVALRGGTVAPPASGPSQTLVGCGHPLDQEVRILDPETRCPLAPGRVGEIAVVGASVARGYWECDEAELSKDFTHDANAPSVCTGDLGFFDADGELFVTGRRKDLVVLRGQNFYPQDIEIVAERSHPALRAGCAAAFGIDVDGEERLVVVCELERRHRPDPRRNRQAAPPPTDGAERRATGERRAFDPEVQAFAGPVVEKRAADVAQQNAAPALDPHRVIGAIRMSVAETIGVPIHAVVLIKAGTIHKTSSGKIMRGACRSSFLAGELEVVSTWTMPALEIDAAPPTDDYGPPRLASIAEIRAWLVRWCVDRLAFPEELVDTRKSFASYGLDSAGAVSLAEQAGRWLGRKLPVSVAFDFPTVDAMAAALVETPGSKQAPGTVATLRRAARAEDRLRRAMSLVDSMSDQQVSDALRSGAGARGGRREPPSGS